MLEFIGEVFVLDDGSETDLDLGNYERFLDIRLTHNSNLTTGASETIAIYLCACLIFVFLYNRQSVPICYCSGTKRGIFRENCTDHTAYY